MNEIDATYDPKKYEGKWYQFWQEKGYFHAPVDTDKTPFTILMPPPNVTSQLHMGHGTGYSIQDMLIRWKRMKGYNACWLPGTDHAGIATQMMVEKELEAQGLSRIELGREGFVAKLHAWKERYGGIILEQFKSLGFSCDWQRLAYTLDPMLSKAVREVFVRLYRDGLIYRGERLVNWDTVLKTAVSDDEVESKEIAGHIWQFRYPIEGSSEEIPIATTRPETMLGDTAVAVNPEDERYRHLIGKQVRLPFTDRLIPIIADEYVKSEFGTGAVKITPAHDPNDFEIGKRHQLNFISILNDDGTLAGNTPERFRGMDRFAARKAIIKALKELELFDEEKSYKHAVPHSERSKTVIEPKLSKQWYVRMQDLAKPAAAVARSGELAFYPESWKKTYLYWLDNIQDWCISRQLWWGHRIPIWYCADCGGESTGLEDPSSCEHCNSNKLTQDEDVLDTWFSSWLWPLSPFGWPNDDQETEATLDYFNPSDVLVTAPEIIFLWVARMVMANLRFKNRLPFKAIYFNATICDQKGRKFSKTLGNGIDPLEVVDQYGADAVRYTALSLAPLGGRVKMSPDDFTNGARFANKIWNASRLLLQNMRPQESLRPLQDFKLNLANQWLLTRLHEASSRIDADLEQYRINDAVEKLYHFVWGDFCDWGLECAKDALADNDEEERAQALSVLTFVLDGALRLAHPVMPFITEEIWQKLPLHPDWQRPESIVIAKFPQASELPRYDAPAAHWQSVQEAITAARSLRQQSGIAAKEPLSAFIRADQELVAVFQDAANWITKLGRLQGLEISNEATPPAQSIVETNKGFEVYIPVAGLIDIEVEIKRLEQEAARLAKILKGLEAKLGNDNFVARAPADIIAQTKAQQENLSRQAKNIETNLVALRQT